MAASDDGQMFGNVKANDLDTVDSVTYAITKVESYVDSTIDQPLSVFSINPETGYLTLHLPMLVEGYFIITISATDEGNLL